MKFKNEKKCNSLGLSKYDIYRSSIIFRSKTNYINFLSKRETLLLFSDFGETIIFLKQNKN